MATKKTFRPSGMPKAFGTAVVLSTLMLGACAGKQQALELTETVQKQNKASSTQTEAYIDGLIKLEASRDAFISHIEKLVKQDTVNAQKLSLQCQKSANRLMDTIATLHDDKVLDVYHASLSAKAHAEDKIERGTIPLKEVMDKLQGQILSTTQAINSGSSQMSSADLVRLKTNHMTVFGLYNIMVDDAVTKYDAVVDRETKAALTQLNQTRAKAFRHIDSRVANTCAPNSAKSEALQSAANAEILSALKALRNASTTESLKNAKKQLAEVFRVNEEAAKALEGYLRYNSFGEGSGLYELGTSIPKGMASGLLSNARELDEEAVREQAKTVFSGVQQEVTYNVSGYKQSLDAIQDGFKKDTQDALKTLLNELKAKIQEQL